MQSSSNKLVAHRLKAVVISFVMITSMLLVIRVLNSRASQPAILITMTDTPASFAPMRTTIKAGDTIEWKNTGNQLHHVTTDPANALKKGDVSSPLGAKPFDSGFLKPGESFSETFSVPGIYRYTCAVHESQGMSGEVVVR
jgi:plastocyanin